MATVVAATRAADIPSRAASRAAKSAKEMPRPFGMAIAKAIAESGTARNMDIMVGIVAARPDADKADLGFPAAAKDVAEIVSAAAAKAVAETVPAVAEIG